jgi:hypothetical protein
MNDWNSPKRKTIRQRLLLLGAAISAALIVVFGPKIQATGSQPATNTVETDFDPDLSEYARGPEDDPWNPVIHFNRVNYNPSEATSVNASGNEVLQGSSRIESATIRVPVVEAYRYKRQIEKETGLQVIIVPVQSPQVPSSPGQIEINKVDLADLVIKGFNVLSNVAGLVSTVYAVKKAKIELDSQVNKKNQEQDRTKNSKKIYEVCVAFTEKVGLFRTREKYAVTTFHIPPQSEEEYFTFLTLASGQVQWTRQRSIPMDK